MPYPIPEPFLWDPTFQVFYFHLDDDHKWIFKSLWDCGNKNTSENLMIFYLTTANHFENEESYMKRANYDYYETHRALHEDFLAKIRQYSAPMTEEQMYFAKDWLVQHIKYIDFKYKDKL